MTKMDNMAELDNVLNQLEEIFEGFIITPPPIDPEAILEALLHMGTPIVTPLPPIDSETRLETLLHMGTPIVVPLP